MLSLDEQERRLCAAFWVWLYAYRKRTGQEPTNAQKLNHPTTSALARVRVQMPGYIPPGR